jgi:GNAT superfamily N-acetyltransferase
LTSSEDMAIEYRESLPEPDRFLKLFQTTGWNETYRLNAGQFSQALNSSWYALCAYDGELLVGFSRVISDGVLHALIVEMIVLPQYQERGIGSHIMEKILARCREAKIPDIQLFCARGKVEFYRKHGFVPRPGDGPGMQYEYSGE